MFNVAANWSGSAIPTSGADLTFTGPNSNTNVGFNTLPFSANSLTFTGTAPKYTLNGNGGILTLGAGGLITNTGGGGVDFSQGINVALGANQTWTTNTNVTVFSNFSGAFALTKSGSGYLALSGNNSYSGGTTISAGTLYLGSTNSSSGTISVASGATLGASYSDLSLSNSVAFASGATFGGSLNNDTAHHELTGAVTLGSSTATMNIVNSDVDFRGTLTGPASTSLTIHSDSTGVAILAGSISNIVSITADNAAIGFGNTAALPANIHAINGGYVSVATLGGSTTTPTVAALLGAIGDKANFNGTIGFDTGSEATSTANYANVSLAGFTSGNVKFGSATRAILSGTITPAGQSYDFAGYGTQGGGLFVQGVLAEQNSSTTSVNITSPNSQGANGGGLAVVLQGANTFSGNLSVSNSIAILDSAAALPSKNFSLGANSYVGITENASYTNFADFAGHLQSGYTTTSILGLDSAAIVANFVAGSTGGTPRTITDTIDLTSRDVTLGTVSGVTIGGGSTIIAPTSGVLRLVNLGEETGSFTIDTALTTANGVTSVVAGMPGSEGNVVLNVANNYTGGTTMQGGNLLVGNSGSLGSGNVTVLTADQSEIGLGAAAGSISLSNNIAVTDNLNIGNGTLDRGSGDLTVGTTTLTLTGVISDIDVSHHGRLYLTGPTTLSGNNTYSGGTYVLANTTVTTNNGLGTGFVDIGKNAVLTLSTANPTIGYLANAGQFLNNGGTGNIVLDGVTSLTINQAGSQAGNYSGTFSGSTGASLIKNGSAQLNLLGANSGQFTGGVTINAGNLSIGDTVTAGATFNSNVALAGGGLLFRPSSGQTLAYNGSITTSSGSGAVTIGGNGTSIVDITGGSSTFTGSTNINSGTLRISADNAWSSASATNLSSGATVALQVNANQTFLNLGGTGKVDIAASKTLTVDTNTARTLSGVVSGSGALAKIGSSTLTLSATNTYSGGTSISAGTLIVSNNTHLGNASGGVTFNGGTLQTNGGITANRTATFTGAGTINTNGQNSTWSGALSGSGNFTKSGSGNLFLTGASPSFTGQTNVTGGSLIVNASLANSSMVVNGSGKLYGNGTIGAATISVGGTIGAGSSVNGPGTLSASSITFTSVTATYDFLLSNATGAAGTGWGLMAVSGAWDFGNAPFTIAVSTVNGGVFAPASNFDPNAATQFLAATVAGGITGFVPGNATFNTSNFSNSFPGSFSASVTGNNLYLNYSPTAIPEPATTAALAGLAALGLVAWRRQRSAKARAKVSE